MQLLKKEEFVQLQFYNCTVQSKDLIISVKRRDYDQIILLRCNLYIKLKIKWIFQIENLIRKKDIKNKSKMMKIVENVIIFFKVKYVKQHLEVFWEINNYIYNSHIYDNNLFQVMGCGASKQQQERLQSYKQKLEELGQINGQLAKQIADLKDARNKRKPIYIIKDQEVEELTSYKEELEKKFQMIEKEILRLNKQLQIQAKVEPKKKRKTTKPIDIDDIADEEEWKKNMMNDNDITIKPFDDAQLEIESDNILKKDIEKNSQSNILMLDSQQNIKKQIANAEKKEDQNHQEQQQMQFNSQKIIIQIEQFNEQNNIDNQSNQQDLQKIKISIQEALGQDLQAYNDEIKNKLFSQDLTNQPQQNLKNSDIEICFNEQSQELIAQSPERNITTLPKKSKQSQLQSSAQVQNQQQQKAEKQLFFSKQRPSVNNQQRNSKYKYQL